MGAGQTCGSPPPAHPWTTQLETDEDVRDVIAGAVNR